MTTLERLFRDPEQARTTLAILGISVSALAMVVVIASIIMTYFRMS